MSAHSFLLPRCVHHTAPIRIGLDRLADPVRIGPEDPATLPYRRYPPSPTENTLQHFFEAGRR